MSFKSLIANGVHQMALLTGYSVMRARAIRAGRIIMFHGVGGPDYPETEFESHLRFLSQHFSITSLGTLADKLRDKVPLTNELVLTFDDGLRNNFTCAYPVLKRMNLTATFFVCPALIENNRWLWNHEARARLRSMTTEQRRALVTRLSAPCSCEIEPIISWMKTLPLRERESVEVAIRDETCEFTPSPDQRQQYDMMSWRELQSLDPGCITVGSHTVNHPILSTLGPEELEFEMAESRRILEEKLQRPVDQFCYPNGSHNPGVVTAARRHYRVAVTTEPGFVRGGEDLLQLPRLGIVPQPLLSWRLHRFTA